MTCEDLVFKDLVFFIGNIGATVKSITRVYRFPNNGNFIFF